jgi:hypothetical protein
VEPRGRTRNPLTAIQIKQRYPATRARRCTSRRPARRHAGKRTVVVDDYTTPAT